MIMGLKIAICDDENTMHIKLIEMLNDYKNNRQINLIIDNYNNGFSLLKSKKKYDIIFMDYQMNGIDGIETSRKIRETNNDSVIIFVSSYPEIALDSFKVKTFRFLKKPVSKEKLFKAIDDYIRLVQNVKYVVLNTWNGTYKIKSSDIICAEALGNHTKISTISDVIEIPILLKEFEKKLDTKYFFRCQRSFIVGFEQIKSHTKTDIFLSNGMSVPIGKKYFESFKILFQKYIIMYNKERS